MRGVNAMGGGASNVLTLNGGVVGSNDTRTMDNTKYGGSIVIGGNVQFGELSTVVSIASSTANLSFANNVRLGSANRTLTLGNHGVQTFSGVISNTAGGLTFAANSGTNGRFEITNAANTFTGDIAVTGGEVRFTSDGTMGNAANDIIIDGGRFGKASDATTVTIGAGRSLFIGDGLGTAISSPSSGTLVYDGAIADKAGETGSWAKQGSGTLELGGASTYTGGTTVSAGSLKVANTSGSATGTGDVTIGTGSTILGSGIISPSSGGTVTVESGGKVAVGEVAGTPGDGAKILTFKPATGSMTTTFETGSTMEFDLFANNGNNYASASSADLFRTGGSLVFETGVTLRVLNAAVSGFSFGDVWRLLDWSTLGGSASGDYTQLALDLPGLSSGHSWDISQIFVNGSISVVPEPSRALLLAIGLLGIISRRRRA